MNHDEFVAYYEKRKADFTGLLQTAKEKINVISNARIFTALVFVALLYFSFSHTYLLYFGLPLVAIFTVLVRRHGVLFKQKVHLENLCKINAWEIQALQGDASCFHPGSEFIDPHHPYSQDLDIFGEGSLFQALNRANTIHGKREMAHHLSESLPTAEDIHQYQDASRELAAKTDFRQHFQAAGLEMGEEVRDRDELLAWLRIPSLLGAKGVFRILLIVWPTVTVASVWSAFFVPAFKPVAILLALSQWVFLGFYSKRVNELHEYISRKKSILEKYAHILHYLQHEQFTSSLLQHISGRAREADVRIKTLASLVSAFNARLNAMTNLVVNSLLLYDLQCVYRLEKWKDENAANLNIWLDAISQAEVLASMGTFAFNHPAFTYASVDSNLVIKASGLGHPLIPENENITNDVLLGNDQSILIITGANMAGKSTFLRALGVNVVLALSGAPVCAESFRCPVIFIRSGMRTADSLKDHQSYFYAELNRLKTIMDDLRADKPLLVLLDEMLRGTNSTDKQLGSIALVKQLLPHPCLAVIATHDLVLGNLENEYPDHIKNYCFEATIEADKLSFDYTLKRGLAQKMNATFLMKKMGIIPGEENQK